MIAMAFFSPWFGPSAEELSLGETSASLLPSSSLNFAIFEESYQKKELLFSYSKWIFSTSIVSAGLKTRIKNMPVMILYESMNFPEVTVYDSSYAESGTLKFKMSRVSFMISKPSKTKISLAVASHYSINSYKYIESEAQKSISFSAFMKFRANQKLLLAFSGYNIFGMSLGNESSLPSKWFMGSLSFKISERLSLGASYDSLKQLSIGARLSSPKGLSISGSWGSPNPSYYAIGASLHRNKIAVGFTYTNFPESIGSSIRASLALKI